MNPPRNNHCNSQKPDYEVRIYRSKTIFLYSATPISFLLLLFMEQGNVFQVIGFVAFGNRGFYLSLKVEDSKTMKHQNWEDRFKEIERDYCRYIEYEPTGQWVETPPGYMNDFHASRQAQAKIQELGLEELYSETLKGMSIRLQEPFLPPDLRAFAIVKMFRERDKG